MTTTATRDLGVVWPPAWRVCPFRSLFTLDFFSRPHHLSLSPVLASAPTVSKSSGMMPALFQILVFPRLRWMPADLKNDCLTWRKISATRKESQRTWMSSDTRRASHLDGGWHALAYNAACMAQWVSLLTPLTLQDLMRRSLVVVPHIRGIFAVEHPDERKERARSGLLWGASNIDFRLLWWKASIPSVDNKVFVGSNSIIDLTTRATQSVPARVESAYWNGMHAFSNFLAHC